VVLFCVKSYDTGAAAALLPALLGSGGALLSLQNGVDSEETLAEVLGADRVIGGAAYIFSTVAEPGVIEHTGGPARLVIGEMDGQPSQRTVTLLQAFQDAGIESEIAGDIRVVLWTKFAFICATAGMTAATRLPLGDIRSAPASWDMFARVLGEVVELGRREGVPLGSDVPAQLIDLAAGLEPHSYSSLHHDLVTGHRMELEALHGTVVARAKRLNLAVPSCEAINAVLQPWARRNAWGSGSRTTMVARTYGSVSYAGVSYWPVVAWRRHDRGRRADGDTERAEVLLRRQRRWSGRPLHPRADRLAPELGSPG
jgi:2-dehydropantoate 2-reductase